MTVQLQIIDEVVYVTIHSSGIYIHDNNYTHTKDYTKHQLQHTTVIQRYTSGNDTDNFQEVTRKKKDVL